MSEVLIILTALIFYTLGRFSGRELEKVNDLKRVIKRKINRPNVGPINFATSEEIKYEGSEQQKIDMEQERLAREAGILR